MKVLLVSTNQQRLIMATPPYGMSCVAATASQGGHDVTSLDLDRKSVV